MSTETSLADEIRGALPWVVFGALALAAAITYFVVTSSTQQNTLPEDYGHNL
ncbi:MAG: hypothetical protein ACI8RZ_004913 [Myxococcota bacterium]|jgi:hypothetical protein